MLLDNICKEPNMGPQLPADQRSCSLAWRMGRLPSLMGDDNIYSCLETAII